MKSVTVNVTTTAQRVWVAIDNDDVYPTPPASRPPFALPDGDHFLLWWMQGKPGDTTSISVVDANGVEVASAKNRKIRPGVIVGGGSKPFSS